MFQRPTQQFSLANMTDRCLLWRYLRQLSWLDLSSFSISCVFEAAFPTDYLLDFGQVMLFLNHDKWNSFWTAVSGANCLYSLLWRKITIFKHGNMRRRLSFLLEIYARKAWSLCYTALSNCYGLELSGAFLLPVLQNLITCLLIYSSMFGGSHFPQLAQLAFTFLIEIYKNRKGVNFY